jgi:hypothetical protein
MQRAWTELSEKRRSPFYGPPSSSVNKDLQKRFLFSNCFFYNFLRTSLPSLPQGHRKIPPNRGTRGSPPGAHSFGERFLLQIGTGPSFRKVPSHGTPERIRTSDTWLRRPVLYPLSYGRIRHFEWAPGIVAQAKGPRHRKEPAETLIGSASSASPGRPPPSRPCRPGRRG